MRNVAPSWSLLLRSSRFMQLGAVIASAGILMAFVGLGMYSIPVVTDTESSLSEIVPAFMLFGGVGLGLLGLGIGIRAATWKRDNSLAKITGNMLAQHLDENFLFIRNISKRQLGYIDAVLIGLPGVLVFRLVDWEGTFLAEVNGWLKVSGNRWVPTSDNPTKEVVDDIKKVRAYLSEYGLTDIPVFGVIVLVNPPTKAELRTKDPIVPSTMLEGLMAELRTGYLSKDRLDQPTVNDIIDLLYDK